MLRLVDTSVGHFVLWLRSDGVVGVSRLDESGWALEEGEWGDGEIGKALFYVVGVPEHEAELLGAEVDVEWRERGGNRRDTGTTATGV
jgi:hypothetical protein